MVAIFLPFDCIDIFNVVNRGMSAPIICKCSELDRSISPVVSESTSDEKY